MAVIIIVLVALAGIGYVLYEQTSIKPSTVSLQLDFTPNPGDSPLFYGVAQGIFKANDINLTIIPGTSVSAAVAALEANKVDFALVSPPTLVDYVANNHVTNLEMVSMEYNLNSLVVIYNNASITSLSGLNGKAGSMVSPTQGDVLGDFTQFADANGLNVTSMSLQFNPVSTSDDLLLAGKVQFIVASIQNLGTVVPAGQSEGMSFGYFVMAGHGLNSAGIAIATTTQMVQSNPSLVQSFVKAIDQSLVQGYENPSVAVTDLVNANPQLNYSSSLTAYEQLLSCCSINPGNLTSYVQYGWISPTFMQQTVNTEIIADNLTAVLPTLNATTLYTDQFVQQP